MRILAAAILLALAGCGACATTVSPAAPSSWRGEAYGLTPAPREGVRIMPPSSYASLWYEVENCSGLRGDFRRVKWYLVATGERATYDCADRKCLGQYDPREHAIYLAERYVRDDRVVRHEMLHALGVVGHPSPVMVFCTVARSG